MGADKGGDHYGNEDGRRRHFLPGLAAVFIVSLAARLAYFATMESGPYYRIRRLQGTDPHRFAEWARAISGGDWIGSGVFNQEPLYPYLLAAADAWAPLLDGGADIARLAQFVLGSLSAAMAFALAWRIRGTLAGLAAGALVAFNGPMIFFEGALLRTSLITFLNTALLVSLCWPWRRRLPRAALAGALFVLALLAKANAAVTLPLLAWALWTASAPGAPGRGHGADASEDAGPGGSRIRAFVPMALACALAGGILYAPVVARNIKAGVPLLSLTKRGAFEYIAGNQPNAPASGWRPDMFTVEINDRAGRKLLRAIPLTLSQYADDPMAFVRLQAEKTLSFLSGREAANNMNYYAELEYAPLLRLGFANWAVLVGLCPLGLAATRRKWRETLPLRGYLVLYAGATIAFYVIGRFRVPMVPAMAVFGGIGAAALFEWFLKKQWKRALPAALAALLIAGLAWPGRDGRLGPNDYYNLARHHVIEGEPERARRWLERGMAALDAEDPGYRYYRAWHLFTMGAPLDKVERELARADSGPEHGALALRTEALRAEVRARRRGEDQKVSGLRFMTP